jgi:hypothetical protein
MRVGRHEHRVSVTRLPGHMLRANVDARTGAVFHDERLPKSNPQSLCDNPSQQVGATPRRMGQYDPHRFRRPPRRLS